VLTFFDSSNTFPPKEDKVCFEACVLAPRPTDSSFFRLYHIDELSSVSGVSPLSLGFVAESVRGAFALERSGKSFLDYLP
jgi:hypothetical protein